MLAGSVASAVVLGAPDLVVLTLTELAEQVRRITRVDGLFLVGVQSREELESLRAATSLPFVLGTASPALADRAYLAGQGVRIVLQGHAPFQAAAKAMYEALQALRDGATGADLRG